MNLTELKQQVLELSRGDQMTLKALLDELLNPVDPAFDRYWGATAMQRLENLRSGKTKGIPLEEVLKEQREPLLSDAVDQQTRGRE